jgi:ribose transport system permease protein
MPDLKTVVDRYSYAMLLMLIVAGLGFARPESFLTWSNISTVVFQQAPLTILMSFGMTLAIIAKGIDVSMGSVLVLASMLSAGLIKDQNIVAGIMVALTVGAFFGCLNGLLITRVGIDPFIATYGMDWVALGLAYVYTGGVYIYDFPPGFRTISNGALLGGIPNLALIAVVIFFLLHFVTKRTVFGHGIFSAGCNYNATMLSGLDARNIVTLVYVINGVLAAITGILYMARLNAADPGISSSFTLDSIAATLIGGTSFEGGKGSVANTLIGAMIIVFIRNGMNIMGISTNWQQTVIGLVIILSIIIQAASKRLTELKSS